MIRWAEWSGAAFAAAKEKRLPVLLLLAPRRAAPALEEIFRGQELEARAVTIAVHEADRPDIHLRYARFGGLILLDSAGRVRDGAALGAVAAKLPEWLAAPVPGDEPSAAAGKAPVWTGAVGGEAAKGLSPERPRETLAAVLRQKALDLPSVELVLYAAAQWKDAAARERAEHELDRLAGELRRGLGPLGDHAWALRLLWDGFAAFGREAWRVDASDCTAALVRERYDAERRSFRHAAAASSPAYADENALAVLALQRACVFEPGARYGQTADDVLAFLRGSMYDPLLGMIHRKREDGGLVYGLLADAAWSIAAFSDAFQLSGHKPHREFADELARFLFQELWDRDGGGFLDRVAQREDLGLLKEPRLASMPDNAAALEGLWKLHHLKGNANYRRWLEWALARLAAAEPSAAGVARVQDMLSRGRLDLELIGRPGEPGCDGLLGAVHRHYAPRRIVSFVDPDDQDYILAHRLEAPAYPRLFGCVELRPVASADAPAGVPSVIDALG